ncbi:MAG TPA: hypothetical protein VF572_02890 [Candidatus Saccharimonadales bacterium]
MDVTPLLVPMALPDGFFSGIVERAPDSRGRLATAIVFAALGGLLTFFGSKNVLVRVAAFFSTLGAFWLGWLAANTFGSPKSASGRDLSNQALLGPSSGINSLGDLFSGVDALWTVIAIVVGAIIWSVQKGVGGFITGLGLTTFILLAINIAQVYNAG